MVRHCRPSREFSTETLEAAVLLCDYCFRAEKNAAVFVLVAFLYRVIRLLALDQPRPLRTILGPTDWTERESENRLVWACYFVDAMVSSGVEKNECWGDRVPISALPCPEEHFLSQALSSQPTIAEVENREAVSIFPHLDISSLLLLIVRLRTRVLR